MHFVLGSFHSIRSSGVATECFMVSSHTRDRQQLCALRSAEASLTPEVMRMRQREREALEAAKLAEKGPESSLGKRRDNPDESQFDDEDSPRKKRATSGTVDLT